MRSHLCSIILPSSSPGDIRTPAFVGRIQPLFLSPVASPPHCHPPSKFLFAIGRHLYWDLVWHISRVVTLHHGLTHHLLVSGRMPSVNFPRRHITPSYSLFTLSSVWRYAWGGCEAAPSSMAFRAGRIGGRRGRHCILYRMDCILIPSCLRKRGFTLQSDLLRHFHCYMTVSLRRRERQRHSE